MKKTALVFVCVFIMLLFKFCTPDNPVPQLHSFSPDSAVAHAPTFTLTAIGEDFVEGAKIIFNGEEKTTTFVSATELTCQIDPEDTLVDIENKQSGNRSNGPTLVELQVEVMNPEPGGGYSLSVNYPVYLEPLWSEPVTIASISAYTPNIAVDDADHVYVIFPSTTSDMYFVSSADKGDSWNTPTIIENAVEASPADITVDGTGNIYIVWINNQDDAFFKYSSDNGISWSTPANLSNNNEAIFGPGIAVDNSGNINVAWPREAQFTRSTDGGSAWNTPQVLAPGYTGYPDIAVSVNGDIHVVWDGPSTRSANYTDITYIHSTDGGANWIPYVTLMHDTSNRSYGPRMVVDQGGNINVLWYYGLQFSYNLTFRRSTNNGVNWSATKILSNLPSAGDIPSIAVDSAGNLNVVGGLNYPQLNIYYLRSIDDGVTWPSPFRISDDQCSCVPDIANDSSGKNYVVWNNAHGQIVFRKSLH